MAKGESITVGRRVGAPADEVFRYFTNPTFLREWLADAATARSEEGGRLYLGWDDGYGVVGNFTALTPGKRVAFTWLGTRDPGASEVDVTLRGRKKGTEVTVTHAWPGGKKWGKFGRAAEREWERSLENLQSVMETGEDLRFTRRPMLGVMIDAEVTHELAARRSLPVDHGVLLGGVVEGMGAEAAGLAAGDVVVAIGGRRLTGFPSVAAALQGRRAGDTVAVAFYRDGEERTTEMALSGRPIPEIPPTAAALAEYVAGLYGWVDAELAGCFEGVSEEEAAARPAPHEWSAREVVAHLLDGEGDGHASIAELVQGGERVGDGPYENSDLRVRVTSGSYPTLADLLAAHRRLEGQTVALLAGLPEDFVARKGSYWRLAYGFTQARPHYEEHFAQIRAAVAAARAAAAGG